MLNRKKHINKAFAFVTPTNKLLNEIIIKFVGLATGGLSAKEGFAIIRMFAYYLGCEMCS